MRKIIYRFHHYSQGVMLTYFNLPGKVKAYPLGRSGNKPSFN
jgi:hypothetical protein